MTQDGVSFTCREDPAVLERRAELMTLKSVQKEQREAFEAEIAANFAERKKLEDVSFPLFSIPEKKNQE
jgi:hypothetical protein